MGLPDFAMLHPERLEKNTHKHLTCENNTRKIHVCVYFTHSAELVSGLAKVTRIGISGEFALFSRGDRSPD
jgi:hypothetical protein